MKVHLLQFIITVLALVSCGGSNNRGGLKEDSVINRPSITEQKEPPTLLHLKARPDSISINASKTAVIVVDMENDFGSKGGMLDRAGVNISMIQKVITPSANVLTAARQAGVLSRSRITLLYKNGPEIKVWIILGSLLTILNFIRLKVSGIVSLMVLVQTITIIISPSFTN